MANPIPRHSHVKRHEVLHNQIVKSVALGSLATNTTYTFQLRPGHYSMSACISCDGANVSAVELKVKPFLNQEQTLVGRALYSFQAGSSTLATVVSLPISGSASGVIKEFVPDAGSAGARTGADYGIAFHHGAQITMDVNANATTSASVGNLSVEFNAETH